MRVLAFLAHDAVEASSIKFDHRRTSGWQVRRILQSFLFLCNHNTVATPMRAIVIFALRYPRGLLGSFGIIMSTVVQHWMQGVPDFDGVWVLCDAVQIFRCECFVATE